MKSCISLFLFALIPLISLCQEQSHFMGLNLRYISSNYTQTLSSQSEAVDYLTSSFPSSWSTKSDPASTFISSNPQTGGELGINLRLGNASSESRLQAFLELGIAWYQRDGFYYYEYNDSLIGSGSYQTPVGTLYTDTTFRQSRTLQHQTDVLGIYGELRVYSAKSNWLKGYLGTKLLLASTVNSVITSNESDYVSTDVRLGNQNVQNGSFWDYGYDRVNYQQKAGPQYFMARLGIPVGLEARIGKPGNQAGQVVLFLQGEAGLDASTGLFGSVTFYSAMGLGLRYHL